MNTTKKVTSHKPKFSYTSKELKGFSSLISKYLDLNLKGHGTLNKSIRYSTTGMGKRIRPVLCMAGFKACGGRGNSILPVAGAIELIHTFSLIHDDLPCMDNDDYRRGKPTNHKVFGEDIALLAGDALLNMAFEWVTHAKGINNDIKLSIIKELTACVGTKGLIQGQVLDLHPESKKTLVSKKISKRILKDIYIKKTALLITTAVRIGAITAGANKRKLDAITEYGMNLGLAFQIVDDILDIDQDEGKSYPSLFGKDNTIKYAKELINKSIRALKPFNKKSNLLEEISHLVLNQI